MENIRLVLAFRTEEVCCEAESAYDNEADEERPSVQSPVSAKSPSVPTSSFLVV